MTVSVEVGTNGVGNPTHVLKGIVLGGGVVILVDLRCVVW